MADRPTVEHRVIEDVKAVRSLSWSGDSLIDWCGGIRKWHADGSHESSQFSTPYWFDMAVTSPCGEYVCTAASKHTKGVIRHRRDSQVKSREINRSYYFAGAYSYPVTFATLADGRTVIIHCPGEYNRLEMEDPVTGERLGYDQQPSRSKDDLKDVFHSRLSISPSGKWLMSNGWYWHPHETVELFSVEAAAKNIHHLNKSENVAPQPTISQDARFLPDDRIMIRYAEEWCDVNGKEIPSKESGETNTVAIWTIGNKTFDSVSHFQQPMGVLMPIDDRYVVDLFEHPKLIDLKTGETLETWETIDSGKEQSCISVGKDPPAVAINAAGKRLAVHNNDRIDILKFGD